MGFDSFVRFFSIRLQYALIIALCTFFAAVERPLPARADESADLRATVDQLQARVSSLEATVAELKKNAGASDSGQIANRNRYFDKLESQLRETNSTAQGSTGASDTSPGRTRTREEHTIQRADLPSADNTLLKSLTDARSVPYFREGQSVGVRLFAIRSGSIFEKMGLKNGDIIKSSNGAAILSPEDFLRLPMFVPPAKSPVILLVERSGAEIELKIHISDGDKPAS